MFDCIEYNGEVNTSEWEGHTMLWENEVCPHGGYVISISSQPHRAY